MLDYSIEPMTGDDWEAVRAIYLEGIATGNATFETEAPDWATWNNNHLKECRLVARAGNEVIGWAALSPVSSRGYYSGVAENSIYISGPVRGKGVGRALLGARRHLDSADQHFPREWGEHCYAQGLWVPGSRPP
jgi:L-amino acid N-acyltransferase YncA